MNAPFATGVGVAGATVFPSASRAGRQAARDLPADLVVQLATYRERRFAGHAAGRADTPAQRRHRHRAFVQGFAQILAQQVPGLAKDGDDAPAA